MRIFLQSKMFITGASILIFLILVAIFQPLINKALIGDVHPISMGTYESYLEPSAQHWLGTDRWGRDWMAELVLGLRYSLVIGALAGVVATLVAILFGFIAGYKGGLIDNGLRTFTDMILVIPSWPILVTLAAYIQGLSIPIMALLLAMFSWPFGMRTIRAQVLSLRAQPYVDLARVSNLNDLEIIFQELVPNLLPFLGVALATSSVGAILAETGLELIGLGPGGDIITLGLMVNFSLSWGALALGKYELLFPPVIVLILIFVSLNLINMGLEELFNPRLKRITGG
ncbi:MAG: ABC transporter permease [Anaerolineaceae bacterium]|nr:ABC transporter permease [Anaerolineaceae bacterium]